MKGTGVLPIITIPRRYWPEIQQRGSLEAKPTYIPGFTKLIGSIGILPPFLKYGEEDRILCEVQCEPDDLEPRATGENDTFHGIIGFKENRIPLDRIRIKQNPPFLSS